MKKALHILAIIAVGAMILGMTGCASVGAPAGADLTALSSGPFAQQKKAAMGFIFIDDLLGSKVTITQDLLIFNFGKTMTYDGPYTIDGSTITAETAGYRNGHPEDKDMPGMKPRAKLSFTITRDKKGVLFLTGNGKKDGDISVNKIIYKQKPAK
ncbi:hypothetical protein AGMMS49944_17490 [Spirochaetia bacterium]|nr:hypothetical protein AGMMS49944_17490 [Spirochaetia bacterium]